MTSLTGKVGRVYVNDLLTRVRYLSFGIAVAALGFSSLLATYALKHSDPVWVPTAMILAGVGLAAILPLTISVKSLPNFLSVTNDKVSAIYGKRGDGRRLSIMPEDITSLEGGGEGDYCVVLWCRSPEKPDQVLRFHLPNESYASLESYRQRRDRMST